MSRKDKEEKQIYSGKWSPETSVDPGPNILGYEGASGMVEVF